MLARPFRRIIRPFHSSCGDGHYYIDDSDYCDSIITLCRAYHLIQDDLATLFNYIEPSRKNGETYSHRTFELLLRACTEVEASCKGILAANGYSKSGQWNIVDYHKVEQCSRLSAYEVQLRVSDDDTWSSRPFAQWETSHSLVWYSAYNDVKHHRNQEFEQASLNNVLNAISGLLVLLFSQFHTKCFTRFADSAMYRQSIDGWLWQESVLFAIKPPEWPEDDQYQFVWSGPDKVFDSFSFK